MSNKKKILFLKIYLVIFMLKYLFTIIGVQYIADKFNYTYDETKMMFLLSMAVDLILLVVFMLLRYFIKLEPEIVKADKYALRFDTYEQLKTFLARRVIAVGYEHKKP